MKIYLVVLLFSFYSSTSAWWWDSFETFDDDTATTAASPTTTTIYSRDCFWTPWAEEPCLKVSEKNNKPKYSRIARRRKIPAVGAGKDCAGSPGKLIRNFDTLNHLGLIKNCAHEALKHSAVAGPILLVWRNCSSRAQGVYELHPVNQLFVASNKSEHKIEYDLNKNLKLNSVLATLASPSCFNHETFFPFHSRSSNQRAASLCSYLRFRQQMGSEGGREICQFQVRILKAEIPRLRSVKIGVSQYMHRTAMV